MESDKRTNTNYPSLSDRIHKPVTKVTHRPECAVQEESGLFATAVVLVLEQTSMQPCERVLEWLIGVVRARTHHEIESCQE